MDQRLRELEVAWRLSGAVDDEARWLHERLRAGDVTERGLVVAAGLGHAAATLVAPAIGLGPLELLETPSAAPFSECPRARAGLAAARAMRRAHVDVGGQRGQAIAFAIWAVEEWVRCPCGPHGGEAIAKFEAMEVNVCGESCCWRPGDEHAEVAGLALEAASAPLPWSVHERGDTFEYLWPSLLHEPDFATIRGQLEAAIRAEVIPWALGGLRGADRPPANRCGLGSSRTPKAFSIGA